MLNWLKDILGESYSEDVDKKISAEIGKGFVAKADFDAANTAKKAAEEQLATAAETIDSYKNMDIDGIRASAENYKADAEAAKKAADERVAAAEFGAALDTAILGAKGRSAKAIKAMLDVDTLAASKDREADIGKALAALKTESGYLFESEDTTPPPPPYAAGTGGRDMTAPTKGDAMRQAMGLPVDGK